MNIPTFVSCWAVTIGRPCSLTLYHKLAGEVPCISSLNITIALPFPKTCCQMPFSPRKFWWFVISRQAIKWPAWSTDYNIRGRSTFCCSICLGEIRLTHFVFLHIDFKALWYSKPWSNTVEMPKTQKGCFYDPPGTPGTAVQQLYPFLGTPYHHT